jgi:hypothetical protein
LLTLYFEASDIHQSIALFVQVTKLGLASVVQKE